MARRPGKMESLRVNDLAVLRVIEEHGPINGVEVRSRLIDLGYDFPGTRLPRTLFHMEADSFIEREQLSTDMPDNLGYCISKLGVEALDGVREFIGLAERQEQR